MLDIVQVSDLHLSPTHAWFQDNYDVFVDEMQADPPDFIFVTGDVCVNGPDRDWEFAYAREQLDRLPVRWRAIPGNHDSGDTPPDERNHHPLTEPLRAAFHAHVDQDWWVEDLANWRFIGLNAQLIDSDLPKPPKTVHIMLNSAPTWVDVPAADAKNLHFAEYPELSIEDWHRQHGMWGS